MSDLVIRSDVVEINDGDQFLGSLGFLLVIDPRLVLESWASKPEDGGTVVGSICPPATRPGA